VYSIDLTQELFCSTLNVKDNFFLCTNVARFTTKLVRGICFRSVVHSLAQV